MGQVTYSPSAKKTWSKLPSDNQIMFLSMLKDDRVPDVIITSAMRAKDKKSAHSTGQAIDVQPLVDGKATANEDDNIFLARQIYLATETNKKVNPEIHENRGSKLTGKEFHVHVTMRGNRPAQVGQKMLAAGPVIQLIKRLKANNYKYRTYVHATGLAGVLGAREVAAQVPAQIRVPTMDSAIYADTAKPRPHRLSTFALLDEVIATQIAWVLGSSRTALVERDLMEMVLETRRLNDVQAPFALRLASVSLKLAQIARFWRLKSTQDPYTQDDVDNPLIVTENVTAWHARMGEEELSGDFVGPDYDLIPTTSMILLSPDIQGLDRRQGKAYSTGVWSDAIPQLSAEALTVWLQYWDRTYERFGVSITVDVNVLNSFRREIDTECDQPIGFLYDHYAKDEDATTSSLQKRMDKLIGQDRKGKNVHTMTRFSRNVEAYRGLKVTQAILIKGTSGE